MFTLTPTGKTIYYENVRTAMPTSGRPGGNALADPIVAPQIEGVVVVAYGPGTSIVSRMNGSAGTVSALLAVGAGDLSLVTLANDLKTKYEAHRVDITAHSGADAANVVTAADASDLPTAITLLNDIRTQYEAHRVVTPAVHIAADVVNAVTAPAATDLTSAVTLANDLRTQYEAHRVDLVSHAAADSTNVIVAPAATASSNSVMLLDGDDAYPLGTIELLTDPFNRLYAIVKDRAGTIVAQNAPAGPPVVAGKSVTLTLIWDATAPVDGTRHVYMRIDQTPVTASEWIAGTDPLTAWTHFTPTRIVTGSDVQELKLSALALL